MSSLHKEPGLIFHAVSVSLIDLRLGTSCHIISRTETLVKNSSNQALRVLAITAMRLKRKFNKT